LPDTDIKNKLLVEEFKNGNQKAFKKLYELYWERMFFNAKMILVNEALAKDVVQEIWINLWEKRAILKIRNFESYVFQSVRFACYKYLRDNKFLTVQLEIVETLNFRVEPSINKLHDMEATQRSIEKTVAKLTPRCRQIFMLSHFRNTSNDEIAGRLGISKKSVENQISIALKYIKQNLMLIKLFSFLPFILF